MQSGLLLSQPFGQVLFQEKVVWLLFFYNYYCFIEILVYNTNRVDPDQMLQYVYPICVYTVCHLWDIRHK